MKTTDHFKNTIKSYLDKRAQEDPLFAEKYSNEKKNINDCVTYILNTVQKTGCNGFTDDEVYGMAVHYYDEESVDIGKEISCFRRQQLQMMLEWRDGIKSIEEDKTQKAIDYWNDKIDSYDRTLNEVGHSIIRKLVKKYGVLEVLDAMDIAEDKYITDGNSSSVALTKVGGILYLKNAPEHKQLISYIKGICRNTFSYFDEKRASIALNNYYKDEYDLDYLKDQLSKGRFKSWHQFISYVEG